MIKHQSDKMNVSNRKEVLEILYNLSKNTNLDGLNTLDKKIISVETRGAARIFLRGGLKLWKQKPCKGKIACD